MPTKTTPQSAPIADTPQTAPKRRIEQDIYLLPQVVVIL